jgi:hypothetical protein
VDPKEEDLKRLENKQNQLNFQIWRETVIRHFLSFTRW